MKEMAIEIAQEIKYKLTKYFEIGFDSGDLIILIPTRFSNVLVGYIEKELIFKTENSTNSTESKSYIWGIGVKRVNDLDSIYVSLK